MIHRFKLLVSVGVLVLTATSMSAQGHLLSEQDALLRAREFFSSVKGRMGKPVADASGTRLVYTAQRQGQPYFYVFNNGNDGFIIAGADDRLPAVLAYSDAGAIDMSHLPENMKYWMGECQRQAQWVLEHPALYGSRTRETSVSYPDIEPIVTAKWSDRIPFNSLCPTNGKNQTLTGSVAVAMGQIMHHYRWPEKGRGSVSYECTSLAEPQTISVDFENTVYDWDNMLDEYTVNYTEEQVNAVATLLYNCGAAIRMQYGSSKGVSSYNALDAFVEHFAYDPALIKQYNVSDLSPEETGRLIIAELEADRPVFFTGEDSANEGMAFIIDGWNVDGYAHINWGMGGYSDGYFLLSALDPYSSDQGYNYNQRMILGIQPIDDQTPSQTPEIWAKGNLLVENVDGVNVFKASNGKIYNNSTVGAAFSITAKYINRKTEDEYVAEKSKTVELGQGDSIDEIADEFEAGIPDGNYKVQLVYKVAVTDEWKPFRHIPYGSRDYVYATVKDGSVSYSNEDNVIDLNISDWVYEKIMNPYQENPISFTVTNMAEKDYEDTLQVALYDSVSGTNRIINKFRPSLKPKQSKEIKITFGGTKNDSTLTNGTYSMSVIDREQIVFGERQEVVLDTLFNNEGFQGSKLKYHVISDSLMTCEVVAGDYKGEIVIPEKVIIGKSAYRVTGIARGAFNSAEGATSVAVPKTVTSIDFDENFTHSVKSISVAEENPVYKSENGIVFSKDGTTLLRYPGGKDESSYTIPDGVTRIGRSAFYGCKADVVTMNEGIKSIEEYAFAASAMTIVYIPASVESIGQCAFSLMEKCTQFRVGSGNLHYTVFDGVLYSLEMRHLIQYPLARTSSIYSVPEIVTEIDAMAFAYAKSLTMVKMPSTLLRIDDKAFYNCTALTEVNIPSNVTDIADEAFARCTSLRSISLGQSLRNIGKSAFAVTVGTRACLEKVSSLSSVPPTLCVGENETFDMYDYEHAILYVKDGCMDVYANAEGWKNFLDIRELAPEMRDLQYNITSTKDMTCEVIPGNYTGVVIIPETVDFNGITYTVTNIAAGSFSSPAGAISVTIPRTVTNIELPNFEYTVEEIIVDEFSKTYSSEKGVLYNKNKSEIICFPSAKLPGGHFEVLRQVKKIGARAFFASKLESITIPEGVVEIDSMAFAKSYFKALALPRSLEKIGRGAFVDMKYCAEFTADLYGVNYRSYNGVLYDYRTKTLVQYPLAKSEVSYTVEDGTLHIGPEAFMGNTCLEKFRFNPGLETIGDNAFYGCNKIKDFTIPNNVIEIGAAAFANCTSLENFRIGRGAKKIGAGAFSANIEDPAAVSHSSLQRITSGNTEPPELAQDGCPVFDNYDYSYIPLYVPYGTTEAYKAAEGWNKFRTIVELEKDKDYEFEVIGDGEGVINKAPSGLYGEVIVPESFEYRGEEYKVVKISDNVFENCTAIKSIVIGKDVRSIGAGTFYGCKSLNKIVIEGQDVVESRSAQPAMTVGSRAFGSCTRINEIIVNRVLPPALQDYNVFEQKVYNVAELTVPAGCIASYWADPIWKNFVNVEEDATLGVQYVETDEGHIKVEGNTVIVDGTQAEVYTVGGSLVARSQNGRIEGLLPGIYVVRAGSAVAKIAVK